MTFRMTMDRVHRITTALVAVALGLVSLVLLGAALSRPDQLPVQLAAGIMALTWLVLAVAWALSPVALRLSGAELWVLRRAWRPWRINLQDICQARTQDGLVLGLRLCGTGGFFGSYGWFWVPRLGRVRVFASRCVDGVVLLRAQGVPLVVTPDARERFVEALGSWQQVSANGGG